VGAVVRVARRRPVGDAVSGGTGLSPRAALDRRRNRALALPNADGSQLEGFIEFPLNGDAIERVATVAGWHAWDHKPVAVVTIELNGRIIARSREAGPRPDVASKYGNASYASTGWVVDLDLRGLHATSATLVATVYPIAERGGVRLDPITVRMLGDPTIDREGVPYPLPPEVLGSLDAPPDDAVVALGALAIKGWARSTCSPVARVSLSANGIDLGRARLGLHRADVADSDAAIDAPISGFEQFVDLSVLGAGTEAITLRAEVVALDGTTDAFEHHLGVAEPEGLTTSVPPGGEEPVRVRPDAPFNLLVVTHDLGYGGAQLWLFELLRQARAGSAFPCTVISFHDGALASALADLGIEVHVTSGMPVGSTAAYEGRIAELSSWLNGKGHSAALVNTFRSFGGADLAERLGLPVVWAIHESWPESLIWLFDHPEERVAPAIRSIAARSLARAGAVIFESDATRALYEARAPGRTALVPYGVETAALDSFASATSKSVARERLGIEASGRVLLVMGTIEPRKSQTLIAHAFCELASRYPDAQLIFVGDLHTTYSAALVAFVERAGLGDRIRLVSVTPDALTWYRASDVLVCGSDIESLPRSVLDAMCLGVPVVATRVFGLAELLEDGATGLLYEPCDLAAAIDALDRVLAMPDEQLAAIAERGSALVHAHHDAAHYASDVVALLAGLQRDPAASPADLLRAR
jgi:glycosyltransferase involved in cell wall biosynthesis